MGSRRDADLAHVLTCYKEMTKFWAFFPSFRLADKIRSQCKEKESGWCKG